MLTGLSGLLLNRCIWIMKISKPSGIGGMMNAHMKKNGGFPRAPG
jgi:hypothetical protein